MVKRNVYGEEWGQPVCNKTLERTHLAIETQTSDIGLKMNEKEMKKELCLQCPS